MVRNVIWSDEMSEEDFGEEIGDGGGGVVDGEGVRERRRRERVVVESEVDMVEGRVVVVKEKWGKEVVEM